MELSKLTQFKSDFLSSIVVFLVALPLCMGIAIASGAPVAAGLITGIVGGLVVGALAGCPLQVSGPAAGLIVLVYEIVHEYGLETLAVVVLLTGLVQLAAGLMKLGQWFRAVSPAVIKGMLAGIGVLIFASQFHVMVDDRPQGSGIANLLSIPRAIGKSLSLDDLHDEELRSYRTRWLREVGDLHQAQAHLHHAVSEGSHHPEEHLAALIRQQEDIVRRLASLDTELSSLDPRKKPGGRISQIHAAAKLAERNADAALTALQADHLKDAAEEQARAAKSLETLLARSKNHSFAALLGVATIAVILLWGLAPAKLRIVPAPLIAVVVATTVAAVMTLPVLFVEVPARLWDELHFPAMSVLSGISWGKLAEFVAVFALVASAETLLCATAVDQMQNGPRTRYDRELCAQGIGNMICGCLGALPMTGVIVRSSANIQAGAKTRLSAMLHGAWLFVFVVGLGFLLGMIPTASLAAILVYTGVKLVDIKSIRELRKYGWGEVVIYVATVATIIGFDLLTGVLTGLGLATGKLLYTFSHLKVKLEETRGDNTVVLKLEGAATFLRLPRLAKDLERVPDGALLHVDFERLDYIDHACLNLLMTWAKQHEAKGGRLVLDWGALHAIFKQEPVRAAAPREITSADEDSADKNAA